MCFEGGTAQWCGFVESILSHNTLHWQVRTWLWEWRILMNFISESNSVFFLVMYYRSLTLPSILFFLSGFKPICGTLRSRLPILLEEEFSALNPEGKSYLLASICKGMVIWSSHSKYSALINLLTWCTLAPFLSLCALTLNLNFYRAPLGRILLSTGVSCCGLLCSVLFCN